MKLTFQSIAGKTLMIFVGVFVLIILPVNMLIYSRIKSALEEAETRELKAEAERLLDQVRLDPIGIPLPREGFSLKVQSRFPGRNEMLFESPDFPHIEDVFFSQDALQLETVSLVNLRREVGAGELVFSLAKNNAVIQSRLNEIRNYLWAANVASIAIACVLVFLITSYTTKPIQQIIAVANRIGASRSMERVPVPSTSTETRALAETLNSMLNRLENSIKQQTNFFASAAHELKTPLSVMKTELSMALENKESTSNKEMLESCLKEVDRLSRIIHNFLLISQLQSESLSIRFQTVALDDLLYKALKKVKYLSQDSKASLKVKLDDGAGDFLVSGDPDLIETVLINLLENAIQHAPKPVLVEIELVRDEKKNILRISNPTEEAIDQPEKLKGEFTKVRSFSPGFGMGLWICDQILRLHSGEFQLSVDSGSNFVVLMGLSRV